MTEEYICPFCEGIIFIDAYNRSGQAAVYCSGWANCECDNEETERHLSLAAFVRKEGVEFEVPGHYLRRRLL